MEYKRMAFNQYFIDTSNGIGGTPSVQVNYKRIEYMHGKHKHDACYCVLWDANREVYQVHFQGTSSTSQAWADVNFPAKYYDSFQYNGKDIQLKAASGWAGIYCALKWYIRNELSDLIKEHGKHEVEVIGWSLGSAIAQLCCQDLFFNYGIKSHVFTFGSVKPWFGINGDTKEYLAACYEECYNFGDHNDIVPYLPPFPGYYKMKKVVVKQDRFCLFKLFKFKKYHFEYYKEVLYENIQ